MIDCSNTREYFAEKARMVKLTKTGVCGITCSKCPLGGKNNGAPKFMTCTTFEIHYPQQAISIVQRWSNEHPQRTYLSVLLTHFPKIELSDAGIPKWICPHELGLDEIEDCGGTDICCAECWNQPIKNNEEGGENG